MAAINFPTATSNGQTFTADTGVIYTYIGTPPDGFWSGTFGTTGLATLDGRYIAKNDGNSIQTILTQGLKFNNGTADTILLDGIDGKIGIGTASPHRYLDINHSTHATLALTSGDAGQSSIFFADTDTNIGQISYTHSNNALYFRVNDAERLRIDSSGNVGVGTTSPTSITNYTSLTLNGTTGGNIEFKDNDVLKGSVYNTASDFIVQAQGSVTPLAFRTNSGERMRIDSSGRLLLGTTIEGEATADNLTIEDSGHCGITLRSGTSSVGTIFFSDATSGADEYRGVIQYDHNGDYLKWVTAGAEQMRIDSSGNVGMGLTGPVAKLDVKGAYSISGTPYKYLYATNGGIRVTGNESTVDICSSDAGTHASSLLLRGQNKGYVFINNSDDDRLDLKSFTASGDAFTVHGTTGVGTSAHVNIASITKAGNVGIGTASPNNKLTVFGDSSDGSGSNNNVAEFAGPNRTNGFQVFVNDTNNNSGIQTKSADAFILNPGGGKVGIGTTSPGHNLEVRGSFPDFAIVDSDATNDKFRILHNGGSTQLQVDPDNVSTASHLLFSVDGTERMRIDSSGRLLVGTSTNTDDYKLQVDSNAFQVAQFTRYGADGAHLVIGSSRGTQSSKTALVANDFGGVLEFKAYQGSAFSPIASISAACEAAAASGDTPGRLTFSTTADNAITTTERMRITQEGSVLIGDTAVSAHANRLLQLGKTDRTATYLELRTSTIGTSGILFSEGTAGDTSGYKGTIEYDQNSNFMQFKTNATERMRIQSSGRVLIGKTDTNFVNSGIELREHGEIVVTRSDGECLVLRRNTSNGQIASFRNTAGSTVGTIVTSSSSTAYNTSSDYRLKENVVDLTAAIPRLKTLPVHRFNFISDAELTVDGFLAHEAQLVVPESVTGNYNEVDDDGIPVMQSIDQSKIVPLLTAALQEAIGRIETLETEVAALKAG